MAEENKKGEVVAGTPAQDGEVLKSGEQPSAGVNAKTVNSGTGTESAAAAQNSQGTAKGHRNKNSRRAPEAAASPTPEAAATAGASPNPGAQANDAAAATGNDTNAKPSVGDTPPPGATPPSGTAPKAAAEGRHVISLNSLGQEKGIKGAGKGFVEGLKSIRRDFQKAPELVRGQEKIALQPSKVRGTVRVLTAVGSLYMIEKGVQKMTLGTRNNETGEWERHLASGAAETTAGLLAGAVALGYVGKANSLHYPKLGKGV